MEIKGVNSGKVKGKIVVSVIGRIRNYVDGFKQCTTKIDKLNRRINNLNETVVSLEKSKHGLFVVYGWYGRNYSLC